MICFLGVEWLAAGSLKHFETIRPVVNINQIHGRLEPNGYAGYVRGLKKV